MLEAMRRSAQSVVIILILGVLILAFVIEFGPQSRGCRGGPEEAQRAARAVMSVLGYQVTDMELELWRLHVASEPALPAVDMYIPCYRMGALGILAGGAGAGAGLGENEDPARFDATHFRNAFLIREALVAEAQRLGIAVDDEEVKRALARGRIFTFDHGYWVDPGAGRVLFCGGELPLRIGIGRDGKFDPAAFRARLQMGYRMSPEEFYAFARRNLLALKMQQILAAGVAIAPAEVDSEIRAETEEMTLVVWTIGPAAANDEEAAALQARFDEVRASISDDDATTWLALGENARRADARMAQTPSSGAAGIDPDPVARRREIARSLMAADRISEQVRETARAARIALERPEGPSDEPPPGPEGISIRAQPVTVRPLGPADALPPVLAGLADGMRKLSALSESSPVLPDPIERDAGAAAVKDPAGEYYALREVALVRRLSPWSFEEAVAAAIESGRGARTAAAMDLKRARMLEAWYQAALFDARASDRLDDEMLFEYLDRDRDREAE